MKKADRITIDLIKDLKSKNNIIVIPNYYINQFECDVFAVTKGGYKVEYEIKISKEDLLKDFDKKDYNYDWRYQRREYFYKHDLIKEGKRVNKFYYVIDESLQDCISHIPSYCGIIIAKPKFIGLEKEKAEKYYKDVYFRYYELKTIKPAKILDREKDKIDYKQIAEKISFRENRLWFENKRIKNEDKLYEKKYKNLLDKHTKLKMKYNEPLDWY